MTTDSSPSRGALPAVLSALGDRVLSSHSQHGDDTIEIAPSARYEVAQILFDGDALRFDMLMDSTALDLLHHPEWSEDQARFVVVDHFFSTRFFHRLRVKCRVMEDRPELPSLVSLHAAANWMERETFDLYGIRFQGHPDLRRILLYPEFVGHPLRKDYDKLKEQPLFTPRYPGVRESDPPEKRR